MKNQIIKKMYSSQKSLQLSSGKSYRIIMGKPRDIEIFSATEDGVVRDDLSIYIKSKNDFNYYSHKEKNQETTPASLLPYNKKFTLIIPRSDPEPIFNLSGIHEEINTPIQIPLKSFIDIENNDPVKMFIYKPGQYSLKLDGLDNTSYLKEYETLSDSDLGESLLFSQELQQKLSIPDGPVNIDSLNDEQCHNLMHEILGPDYEQQVHKGKVKAREGNRFWSAKKSVSTTTGAAIEIWNHREVLLDFGFKHKFYVKTIKGKQYIIFTGYNGLRKWYTGTRYKITNPKVINLSAAGKLKSGLKGNNVTILIVGAIDIIDWLFNKEEDKQFSDLCITLGMDVFKAVIGSIISAGLASFILALTSGTIIPVCIVVIGAVGIGIIIGHGLDLLDKKIGTTEYMKKRGHEASSFLENLWQENVIEPLGYLYYQLEKSIENMYLEQVPKLR